MTFRPAFALAALLLAGACTTDRFAADVTRFHLNQPVAKGSVYLQPLNPSAAGGLEFRTYADAVGAELREAGFTPVASLAQAEIIGLIDYGQSTREGLRERSPISIGIGGGTFGRNVGIGVGTTFGLGKGRSNNVNVNMLALQLKRRSDSSVIWEGRAMAEAREGSAVASLGTAVPKLADALLSGYPGPSGQTVRVTDRSR